MLRERFCTLMGCIDANVLVVICDYSFLRHSQWGKLGEGYMGPPVLLLTTTHVNLL